MDGEGIVATMQQMVAAQQQAAENLARLAVAMEALADAAERMVAMQQPHRYPDQYAYGPRIRGAETKEGP